MVSRYQQHRPARLELVSRNEAKPARILRHAAAPARWFTHAADIAELVTVFERRVDAACGSRRASAGCAGYASRTWADGAALLDQDDASERGKLQRALELRVMRELRTMRPTPEAARLRFPASDGDRGTSHT